MMPLAVCKKHIQSLGDEPLRDLLAHLSTAELRRSGQPVSGVRFGGRQEAKDGGIDGEANGGIGGYLPRPFIGFQVKKADLAAKAIVAEMCPGGQLRPSIQALAERGGAYIIASGAADLSPSARNARLTAMTTAAGNAPGLHLDFYDADHLARWVNEFPGIAAWVRAKIGQPVQGWKPFDNWSRPEDGTEASYLLAGDILVQPPKGEAVVVEAGITLLREALARPRAVVRLVGLSGLGKTRLVQALFDDRIGHQALDTALAVYTDIGLNPQPGPQALVASLAQSEGAAIVIVDNCPPETHRYLAKEHQLPGSKVSVLTVEYDVSDDSPEDTKVFRLVVGDEGVVPQLLHRRRPDLSQAACEKITEFAGGNARLALALADTVEASQSLSKLTDEALLKRLFQQRQGENVELLRAAEVCSLVYSFHIDPDIVDAELPVLAHLAGTDVDNFYAQVEELQRRGLVQARGDWRALLPHALAHRLARATLGRRPPQRLRQTFEGGPQRLLRSFTRRLEMLHDVPCAVRIAEDWLAENGLLGDPATFNQRFSFGDVRQDMLRNVAPLAPAAVLAVLERGVKDETFVGKGNWHRVDWGRLLHKLAYEPELFSRSGMALAHFLAAEAPNNASNSLKDSFLNLFNFSNSGTHAPIHQRLETVRRLLAQDGRMAECGLMALDRLLHTRLFGVRQSERFGARPRDTGLELAGIEQGREWYGAIIHATVTLADDFPIHRQAIGESLARHFAKLWKIDLVREQLELAMLHMAAGRFWRQGWMAVRNALKRSRKDKWKNAELRRLTALETRLRPADPVERARAWVLSENWGALGLIEDDDWTAGTSKVEAEVRGLAAEVANHLEALRGLLPDLSRGQVHQGVAFGLGLATAGDPSKIWELIQSALHQVETERRNFGIAIGFLSALADIRPDIAGGFLDRAVTDPVLGGFFPILQARVGFDETGLRRLRQAVLVDQASAWVWERCLWADDSGNFPASDLEQLINLLWLKPNGQQVALSILDHLVKEEQKVGVISPALSVLVRAVISRWGHWQQDDWHWTYHMSELVKAVLPGAEGAEVVRALLGNMLTAMAEGQADVDHHETLLPALCQVQPMAVLDQTLACREEHLVWRVLGARDGSYLDAVTSEILLEWAQMDRATRLPFLAGHISVFDSSGQMRQQALSLLETADDKMLVLVRFVADELSSGRIFHGDRSAILANRGQGLGVLSAHPHPDVRAWAAAAQADIAETLAHMQSRTRVRDERFE